MSSLYTLVVVLPSNRRTNVKISPNSTVLEVLEYACRKHELNADEYDLTHHNKVVDLSKSIRFAGIPNNGTLEMVVAKKVRVEEEVNVGVQLESGKRLMGLFKPGESLWNILEYWRDKGEIVGESQAQEIVPVCIYMRQEVAGREQLENKTLKSLGLTKGSGLIRLIHRDQSILKTQANVSSSLSRPAVPEMEDRHPQKTETETVPAGQKNIVQLAKDTQINNKQEHINDTQAHHSSHPPQQNKNRQATPEPMDLSEPKEKPAEYHFTPPVVNNAQRFSKKGELHVIGPHDALLYHGDDVVIDSQSDVGLDDSFFELTTTDVRRMYLELQKKRQELEESPLLIQSSKELAKETNALQMLKLYPNTIIRIRFANRYVLQGCFRTGDRVDSIYAWVAGLLTDPKMNFYLFTAPPKQVLSREKALVEQELVGMAVLYFGCSDGGAAVVDHHQRVLKPELYEKISAPDAVYDFMHKRLKKAVEEDEGTGGGGGGGSSSASGSSSNNKDNHPHPPPQKQSAPRPTGEVPKWFKTK